KAQKRAHPASPELELDGSSSLAGPARTLIQDPRKRSDYLRTHIDFMLNKEKSQERLGDGVIPSASRFFRNPYGGEANVESSLCALRLATSESGSRPTGRHHPSENQFIRHNFAPRQFQT
ncbi:Hypothetical predicted protein, partial [Marmota monax]